MTKDHFREIVLGIACAPRFDGKREGWHVHGPGPTATSADRYAPRRLLIGS